MNNLKYRSAEMFCKDDECDFFEESIYNDDEIINARKRAIYHAKKTGHSVRFLITSHYEYKGV